MKQYSEHQMKALLKLIKINRSGELALLTNIQEFPPSHWLAYQRETPLQGKNWHRAWPINGGEMLAQEDTYEILRVATKEDIEMATNGNRFNPAAISIADYYFESRNDDLVKSVDDFLATL